VYWSSANSTASGNVTKGEISTSHFRAEGTMPGLFILGKADVDTDEFDQGVIGHEFGHYLQAHLSYDDSPGGNHSYVDYKDASLAFSEGYGTAIGGLLSQSNYYVDSSGPQQQWGSVDDLSVAPADNVHCGFYAEDWIFHLLYGIGTRHGFEPFWNAVSALRAGHHSATIFAFVHHYKRLNPALYIDDLLAAANIKSADPLGNLGAGSVPDTAIDKIRSKGADDLEVQYLTLQLIPASGAAPARELVTPRSPGFCVNHQLPGAGLHNGLGMSRRFVFQAPVSGTLDIAPVDDRGKSFSTQTAEVMARDDTGQQIEVNDGDYGLGTIDVIAGRTYALKVTVTDPDSVFRGNRCGNRRRLWMRRS